jgi:hypothetical protein
MIGSLASVGHAIEALILPGDCDAGAARDWDVVPVRLNAELSLVQVTVYYSAYQQATRGVTERLELPIGFPRTFPTQGVLAQLAAALTGTAEPTFAVVMTNYFGGVGDQWACLYRPGSATPAVAGTVNEALAALGVRAAAGMDEFDTVGLSAYRRAPDHLEAYEDLCDELGI